MLLFVILVLLTATKITAQDPVVNNAFRSGEHLSYELYYETRFGQIKAGAAEVKINLITRENHPENKDAGLYHIVAEGKTNKFFDFFFKVRDRFESYTSESSLLPEQFVNHTREGNYVFNEVVSFDRENGEAVSSRKEIPVPADIHDLLSSVYFLRTVNMHDFGRDSIYYFNFFLDDSVYASRVVFLGRETLETRWGLVPCLKIKPMVATGDVFARDYPVTMWVTDDKNHIPVRAESEIIVGAVVMELADFRNLKNPFIQSLVDSEK